MAKIMLSHTLCKEGMDFLKENKCEVICHNTPDINSVLDDFKKCDGYLLRIGKIDRELIANAPNLKVIARPGVGYDTIDVKAATEYGIPVVITPGANSVSVAEHTIGLIFALAKNTCESVREAKNGNYAIRNKGVAIELQGKTLGIIGYGNIGKNVARMARGIGLRVIVYDPFLANKKEKVEDVEAVSDIYDIYKRSDFVTLHLPLTDENYHMINKETLSCFKEGAFLINCARGALVDEEALYNSLSSGYLAGAAVDLMENEPFCTTSKLFTLPSFIATPHMAALTKESSAKSAIMALDSMLKIINGEQCMNVCNPEVYKNAKWRGK